MTDVLGRQRRSSTRHLDGNFGVTFYMCCCLSLICGRRSKVYAFSCQPPD